MANRSSSSHQARRTGGGINPTLVGAVFLGICILIAGLNIGGGLRKLNKTITDTQFASTNTVTTPSEISVGQKKYLTEKEAGEYLNLSTDKILELISNGEIPEYVKTETGYSISIDKLDAWFDNEAYQMKIKNNSISEPDDDEE
ncbi:MAG: excisionase family DNA-binding protein [Oscillospiraceae bacterium]|nr:excisionase family DNA-binding protein [Oscillospiraceae bacterium]